MRTPEEAGPRIPVIKRWKRFGKDRLYASLPPDAEGGEPIQIGWYDLVDDELHPELPEYAEALELAIAKWRGAYEPSPQATPRTTAAASPQTVSSAGPDIPDDAPIVASTPAPDAATRPWRDLADNRPGASAREEAQRRRDAAPVKSALARVLGVKNDERAWRIGADGEELVAAQIAKVQARQPEWRVLHAVPVGDRGSDIDHVLIGPGGVFTVNVKHHPGAKIWVGGSTFLVDGHKQSYVRNARHEAQRAARMLTAACGFPVHVQGLIVTVNAADVVIKSQPEGVWVTYRVNLVTWIRQLGPILSEKTIAAVYEQARRSTTWTG